MKTKATCLIILASILCSCSQTRPPRTAQFTKVAYNEIEGWDHDSHAHAFQTFQRSCDKILNLNEENQISKATKIGGDAIDWQVPCMEAAALKKPSDTQAKRFFENWFTPYVVTNDDGNPHGTLTGYFQIELEGSRKKHGKYKYPIYKRPDNLNDLKGTDSLTHAAINNGALAGRGLEIAYVDDRARLYLMQIQGSGVVKLKEGGHLNLGFDSSNGYRFTGISQALKAHGLKFESTKAMHEYLYKNPKMAKMLIEHDPSYVFFREVDGEHALGGHGTKLQSERSLAIDYELYPYGMPVWVSSELPEKSMFKGRKYQRLFVAQDTGGAIRGAVRGDVFFGRGKNAEIVANSFRVNGNFYALFPKTVKIPDRYTTVAR